MLYQCSAIHTLTIQLNGAHRGVDVIVEGEDLDGRDFQNKWVVQ